MADDFGNWLKTTRERRGLSGNALAARAGVNQSTISKVESGVRFPSRDAVLAIVEALLTDGATEDDRESLRREALVAWAGIDDEPGQDDSSHGVLIRVPEEDADVIHAYVGIPDSAQKDRIRRILANAVELTDGKEPDDAGPEWERRERAEKKTPPQK